MKIISSTVHGIIDYVLGLALLAAPYLFGFAELGGPAVMIPQVIGGLIIAQSLLTDYEYSLAKIIPLSAHILMDSVVSIFLALSPFLFGFYDQPLNVWLPHIVVGVFYLAVSLMTRTVPERVTA